MTNVNEIEVPGVDTEIPAVAADTQGVGGVENAVHDNATEADITDNESKDRADSDKAAETLAKSGEKHDFRAAKTPAQLKAEAENARSTFLNMISPANDEQKEAFASSLETLFSTTREIAGDTTASFLLGDLTYSAQRNFVSGLRWLERNKEWMHRIATSSYSNAEEQMENAQERFTNNLQQLGYACSMLNSLLDVWKVVAIPDAQPILRDWQVIVNGVEAQEQKRLNVQKEVKDDKMKASLEANVLMMKAMGIMPKSEQ